MNAGGGGQPPPPPVPTPMLLRTTGHFECAPVDRHTKTCHCSLSPREWMTDQQAGSGGVAAELLAEAFPVVFPGGSVRLFLAPEFKFEVSFSSGFFAISLVFTMIS